MKKERAKGENHQRTGLEENAIACGGALRLAIGGQVSRPIMIDRFRWNGEHRGACQSGEYGNHEKDRALGERVADRASQKRNGDISAVIVSGVAAETARELVSRHQPKRERRDRGRKGVAGDREDGQGERHRPEARRDKDDDGADSHRRHGQHDDAALGARHVNRGADRGLERNSEQSTGGCYKADISLAPMLTSNQEHIDERPEQVSDVGGEEVDCVERIGGRNHRQDRKRPRFRRFTKTPPYDLRSQSGRDPLEVGIFIDNEPHSAR